MGANVISGLEYNVTLIFTSVIRALLYLILSMSTTNTRVDILFGVSIGLFFKNINSTGVKDIISNLDKPKNLHLVKIGILLSSVFRNRMVDIDVNGKHFDTINDTVKHTMYKDERNHFIIVIYRRLLDIKFDIELLTSISEVVSNRFMIYRIGKINGTVCG